MEPLDDLPSLLDVDVNRPSPARIYDYWLGGHHNFASDREVAERAAETMPTLKAAIWANRGFLRRIVTHLVTERGITQFLDLGSGVPTVGNVHEIAQDLNPESRVVYVDVDPVAVAHGRELLADNELAAVIHADIRDPASVLKHRQVNAMLDFDKPFAILMIAVLHYIPDSDDPDEIARAFRQHLSPGSFLAISHAAPDLVHPAEQAGMVDDWSQSTKVMFIHRGPERIAPWVDGLEVQPPGLVLVNEWRPDLEIRETILRTYGVLARKPDEPAVSD